MTEENPICMECDENFANNEDPRTPPLAPGRNVLCDFCYQNEISGLIDDLKLQIDDLEKRRRPPETETAEFRESMEDPFFKDRPLDARRGTYYVVCEMTGKENEDEDSGFYEVFRDKAKAIELAEHILDEDYLMEDRMHVFEARPIPLTVEVRHQLKEQESDETDP